MLSTGFEQNTRRAAWQDEPSIAGLLVPLITCLPALFPKTHHGAVLSVASALPQQLSRFFGFECPLHDTSNGPDFLACISRAERTRLSSYHVPVSIAGSHAAERAWERLRQFGLNWLSVHSPLHDLILNLWMEFDLGSVATGILPNVFLGPRELVNTGNPHWMGILIAALQDLSGEQIPTGTRACLSRCVGAMPSGAGVFQAGVMTSRRPAYVRICVTGLQPTGLLQFLADVGWPGCRQRVEPFLDRPGALVDRIDVDLDIGADVGSVLGLEFSFVPKRPPHREPRWLAVVNWLVREGLCLEPECEALLRFAGYSYTVIDSSTAEETHEKESQPSGSRVDVLVRGLNHLKLTFQADRITAKAYLSMRCCSWAVA